MGQHSRLLTDSLQDRGGFPKLDTLQIVMDNIFAVKPGRFLRGHGAPPNFPQVAEAKVEPPSNKMGLLSLFHKHLGKVAHTGGVGIIGIAKEANLRQRHRLLVRPDCSVNL